MTRLRDTLIYLAIIGLEASWLYVLLNAANKAVDDRLSILLLLLVLPISYGVSRLLRYLSWPKWVLAALSWIVWPIVMLLTIKVQLFGGTGFGDSAWLAAIPQAFSNIFTKFEPVLLILISTVVLWWLGRRLAYLKPEFSRVVTEFQFGLIILVLAFFTAYELKLDQSSSTPAALIFFTTGLLGVAISHSRDNSWLGSWGKGNWPVITLVTIGIILLLGLLISLIFTPDLVQIILKGLRWIWEQIQRLIEFILSLFPQQNGAVPAPEIPALPTPGPEQSQVFQLPEWLQPSFTLVYEIVVGGFLLFAFWKICSQLLGWMKRRMSGAGGETESLKGAFKQDLLNFFKKIISFIFRIRFDSRKDKPENLPPEIASVRQLYRQLLKWAGQKGFPRQESQTPEEYGCALGGAVRENQSELDSITRADLDAITRADLDSITQQYVRTRYGGEAPSEAKLEELRQKWHNLRKTDLKRPKDNSDKR